MSAPAYHFDASYRETATLRDGRRVRLRLLGPADKDLLRQGFARMSPQSRYMRFFAVKQALTDKELHYLTEMDQVSHFALAAEHRTEGNESEGLGVARFIRLQERPDTAEAAIAVVDDMQGNGLGSLLFQRLVAAARERGIRRFRCEVLDSNQPMLDLMHELAPGATYDHEDGIVAIEFELPALDPAHPHHDPPRQSPLYKVLQIFARMRLGL